MIYLFESELPKNKCLVIALRNLYGLGRAHTTSICKKLGFSSNLQVQSLSKEQITRLIKHIESLNVLVAGDLLKFRLLIVKKLVSLKSYRGLRRSQGLPVRGQRTHTNSKTARKRLK